MSGIWKVNDLEEMASQMGMKNLLPLKNVISLTWDIATKYATWMALYNHKFFFWRVSLKLK